MIGTIILFLDGKADSFETGQIPEIRTIGIHHVDRGSVTQNQLLSVRRPTDLVTLTIKSFTGIVSQFHKIRSIRMDNIDTSVAIAAF